VPEGGCPALPAALDLAGAGGRAVDRRGVVSAAGADVSGAGALASA
jgi:hypothetical protein